MHTLRYLANHSIHWLANLIGSKIIDYRTGQILGKAIIIGFGGRIHIIGYRGTDFLIEFEPQVRLTYWKQSIRFTQHHG